MLRGYIEKLAARQDLSYEEMHEAMMEILEGTATEIEAAGFLVALKSKKETVEEITAAADVMRQKAIKVKAPSTAIDTCGTGGDGVGTFNISTSLPGCRRRRNTGGKTRQSLHIEQKRQRRSNGGLGSKDLVVSRGGKCIFITCQFRFSLCAALS